MSSTHPASRRRLLQLGAAAAIAAPALVRAARRPELRAGDQKGNLHALLDAAGELKDLDYDIRWTEFPAAAPLAEALNAEAVDIGPIGDAPLIFAVAQGVRIRAFAASKSDPYGLAIIVKPDSGIGNGAQLKGRSIATNRGSIGHYVALRALAAAGLKPTDAQFRFLAPPEAKLALVSGAVDAWATWDPYTSVAETIDGLKVIANGRGLWSGLGYTAATETALREKRALLVDFRARLARSQQWAIRHPDAFAATLARLIGIPLPAAKLTVSRRRTQDVPIDASVVAEQQKSADFYLEAGLLAKRLDVAATSFAAL